MEHEMLAAKLALWCAPTWLKSERGREVSHCGIRLLFLRYIWKDILSALIVLTYYVMNAFYCLSICLDDFKWLHYQIIYILHWLFHSGNRPQF
jgi:hypothetical protein